MIGGTIASRLEAVFNPLESPIKIEIRIKCDSGGVMELFEILQRRLERANENPNFPHLTPEMAEEDAIDLIPERETQHSYSTSDTIDLEPMVIGLEYRDSEGRFSRRRITTTRLVAHTEAGLLVAYCHERGAPRSFSLNRIISIIDIDGVVLAPPDFWNEIGVDTSSLSLSAPARCCREMMRDLRAGLSVLVAMSRVDGRMANRELAAILDWAEDEAHSCGMKVSPEAMGILETELKRLWPGRDQLRTDIQTIAANGEAAARFARTLRRVVLADGAVAVEEARLLEVLAAWASQQSH